MTIYECIGDRVDLKGQVLRRGDRIELDPVDAGFVLAGDVPLRQLLEEADKSEEVVKDVTV